MVTHDLNLTSYADRVAEMIDGRIINLRENKAKGVGH